jgi:hypothetical protein
MKLWEVTIERSIFVLAETDVTAAEIALHAESDESFNEPDFVNSIEIIDLKRVPTEWRSSLPYSEDFKSNKLTCEEFLNANIHVK